MYKNMQTVQSEIRVIVFERQNKYLYRSHFFSKIHRSMNLHKHPQSNNKYRMFDLNFLYPILTTQVLRRCVSLRAIYKYINLIRQTLHYSISGPLSMRYKF